MEITQKTEPEEINEDSVVNAFDLQIYENAALGMTPKPGADVNGDDVVGLFDV